jgi:monoamine oxidase
VNSVQPSGEGVAVETAFGTEQFERAVVALPLPEARRIAFRAGWPGPGGSQAPVVKLGLAFSREFWRDHGWDGSMLSDGAAQQTWRSACGAPVLVAYVCGSAAEALGADPLGAPLRVVEALERAWPGARDAWTDARVCDWAGDEYAGGGFSAPGPGPGYRPHPRVHFVGEPFSEWYGFIEGALESVERLSEEIGDDGLDPG